MKVTFITNGNYDNAEILCRVYENQSSAYWRDPNRNEHEQVITEILYRPHIDHDHERFESWLPRGAANAIATALEKWKDSDYTVGISNELNDSVGVLTSCRVHFDMRIREELTNRSIAF